MCIRDRIITLDEIVNEVKQSEEWEAVKMNILEIGIEKGHHRADQLEKSVHKAGLFFQETGQQKPSRLEQSTSLLFHMC